jgi:prophage DNA circulation protein
VSWKTRLRKQISLTAPDGTAFTAGWQGNDIEAGKRIGQFDYPLIDGTSTQDLGAKGMMFPLTLQFEGDDHDTTAWAFLNAFLHQRGLWTVVHPVYGTHSLQAITGTLSADPTGSANITKVETSWIEPAANDVGTSIAELGAQVSSQATTASASAAAQFSATLDISNAEAQAAAATEGTAGLGCIMASGLSKIIARGNDIQAAFAIGYAAVQAAIAVVPLDMINAASQIITIMQLPALVEIDLAAKVTAYTDFASRLASTLTPGLDASARNTAIVGELFLAAAIAGVCLSASLSLPSTREQAVQAITSIRTLFSSATAALDAVQAANAGNQANQQYFSNGISFPDLARLVGLACAFLLRSLFDLKVAKRFTLDRPRNPAEITITEYGSLGEADAYLDLFIASNALRAQDIILLPAGREVVVYV